MKITNWRRAAALTLAACGLLPGLNLAGELQVNLVSNPGFEEVDTMDPGPFTSIRVLDWMDADGDGDDNFAYPYSSDYSGVPAPPGTGDYHFSGGFDVSTGDITITQSFDVAAGDTGALIAAGNARYDLRAFFSTYFLQSDASFIQARFLNAGMAELASVRIGGDTFLDGLPVLNGRRLWGQDAVTGVLPVGTASVVVDLVAAGSGGNFDGYADNVDFRIGGLPNDVAVALQVDTLTGKARFNNLTDASVNLKYYEVTSASGALHTNAWSSLQSQNLPGFPGGNGTGNGWEESGGVSSNLLAENYLLGMSTLDQGDIVSLGSPFSLAMGTQQDLIFRYGLDNGQLLYGVVEYLAGFGLPCDFTGDGICNIADLDQLYGALGTADPTFDLTGDGQVTDADIPAWLSEASSADPQGRTFVAGDTNLDGIVGGGDFTTVASNFGGSNATWGQGNFDGLGGDGQSVGGSDFTALASNFGFVSVSVAAVPEPSSLALILLGCLTLGRRARLNCVWFTRGRRQLKINN